MFITLNHRLFLATRRQPLHRRHGTRHVQQRASTACRPQRRSVLLRQPPRERRRRPRPALAARVARMLPAEPRPLPRGHAGFHLRAGSPRARSTSISTSRARRRSRVGGKTLGSPSRARCRGAARSTLRVSTRDEVRRRRSSCEFPAGRAICLLPGGLYRYADRVDDAVTIVGERSCASTRPVGGDRLRVARSHAGSTATSSTWIFRWRTRRVVADERVKRRRVGRVAIERGPIVYCAEWLVTRQGRVLDLALDTRAELSIADVTPNSSAGATLHSRDRRVARASRPRPGRSR